MMPPQTAPVPQGVDISVQRPLGIVLLLVHEMSPSRFSHPVWEHYFPLNSPTPGGSAWGLSPSLHCSLTLANLTDLDLRDLPCFPFHHLSP